MWVKTFDDGFVNLDKFDTIEIKERQARYVLVATIIKPTLYRKTFPPVNQNISVVLWVSPTKSSCKDARDVIETKLSQNVNFVRLRTHLVAPLEEGNNHVD